MIRLPVTIFAIPVFAFAETPEKTSNLRDFAAIRKALIGAVPKAWTKVESFNSLLFIHEDVQFMPPYGGSLSLSDAWDKHAQTRDYIVAVTFTEIPSSREFEQRVLARETVREARLKAAKTSDGDISVLDRANIGVYLNTVHPLPQFTVGHIAIWISNSSYYSDEQAKPAEVLDLYPALIRILERFATPYPTAEQGDADQPATAVEPES